MPRDCLTLRMRPQDRKGCCSGSCFPLRRGGGHRFLVFAPRGRGKDLVELNAGLFVERLRIERSDGADSGQECGRAENGELRQIRGQLHIVGGDDAQSAAEHRAGNAKRNEPPGLLRDGSPLAPGSRDGGLRLMWLHLGQRRRPAHGPAGKTRLGSLRRRRIMQGRRRALNGGGQDGRRDSGGARGRRPGRLFP